jgi:8-amino-7-oxononanoate synthase
MPTLQNVASKKLQELADAKRTRGLRDTVRMPDGIIERDGQKLISFTCNDYLGLSQHPQVKAAAAEAVLKYGAGAGASRLVTGNHPPFRGLETALARWKGTEAVLVFGSGYLANTGIIPALVGKDDLIIADKLVHACLIDGARLSGAAFIRFKHNDVDDCKRLLEIHRAKHHNALIVTDEIFSMDGDKAPLAELKSVAEKHDAWLMADGAHALSPCPVAIDVYVGTLSKALGAYGGYVAGSKTLIDLLMSSARSFIFSTGLPPAVIAAAGTALALIMQTPSMAEIPLAKAKRFTSLLNLPEAQSPIVPIILQSEEKTLAASAALEKEGFAVAAIRPPTVPEGTSRLRFTFSAQHTDDSIEKLAATLRKMELV